MEIQELKIFSQNINEQESFYSDVLGFDCIRTSASTLEVITKENKLIFEKSDSMSYYHFAFLIPPKSLESAIAYVEDRSVELLRLKNDKVIYFDSGKAIYFYDKDANIVEFIERPTLKYRSQHSFSADSIIKVNEIGLPVKNPLQVAGRLVAEFNVEPLNEMEFNSIFCWAGDYNGVIIVVKEGRNWLPTDKPAISNDFSIWYEEQGKATGLKFENNKIIRLSR
ncbi:VOC family protein [Kriegella aquimaris]|uniref:VOC domain-containing protein n=1 Tax=Kriegella aquimaris TaxID=192904 RepID=A0A1G9MKK5_9FLAO|nr:hypothetical protein [Kriegella aquimaris]SDL74447.1 hypothetical protein SAMN04488514_102554 [Kriegella aquimaris]